MKVIIFETLNDLADYIKFITGYYTPLLAERFWNELVHKTITDKEVRKIIYEIANKPWEDD